MTIDQLRAALEGQNLVKLAELTGINRRTLQRIKTGKSSPTAATLEAIASKLAVRVKR